MTPLFFHKVILRLEIKDYYRMFITLANFRKNDIKLRKKLGLRVKRYEKDLENYIFIKRRLRKLYLNENKLKNKFFALALQKFRKPKAKVFRLYLEPRNKYKGYCLEFRKVGKTKTIYGFDFIMLNLRLNIKWACDCDIFFEELEAL